MRTQPDSQPDSQPGSQPGSQQGAQPVTAACRQSEVLRSHFRLTPREATIAKLLCLGYAPSGLAERLSLSMNTVRTHLKSIFSKTQTHRQADLVRLLLTTVFADTTE
jgi:DNA-binding CsgD family transcriptional regulator